MQPTLSPEPGDGPCDDVLIAPTRTDPAGDELSDLLHRAARHRPPSLTTSEVTAGPTLPPVDVMVHPVAANDGPSSEVHAVRPTAPPVDAVFRPVPANDVRRSDESRSMVKGAARAVVALLLATCIGVIAAAWKSYGDVATKAAVKLATQFAITSSQPENPALAAQPAPPAVDAAIAATPAAQQPAAAPQTTSDVSTSQVLASANSTQALQAMARDLATLGQQLRDLRTSVEQLNATQQQMLRDAAKASDVRTSDTRASEPNARPRAPAPPPRPPAALARKPIHSTLPPQDVATLPPQGVIAARALPQPSAPYQASPPYRANTPYQVAAPRYVTSYPPAYPPPSIPPQLEPPPQAAAEPPNDPDQLPAPRPPMPVR